jgi:BirA family biotin operon repressor/biotin-[acetyl-CoA-carboxylase] ligase
MSDGAPFDITRFTNILRTETFGRRLIFEASVGSTMDVARAAAAEGADEGAVAFADEQTAGRGRLGRTWLTPLATNIAATLVLRPGHAELREIAMITPLAVVRAIGEVADVRADIKWPNDVQIGGKKAAGILIEVPHPPAPSPAGGEGERGVVLVGTGINVNFDPREIDEIRDVATSLSVEAGREIDREALLAAYLRHFEHLYRDAQRGESALTPWRERLVTLGQRVHAAWPGGSAEGIAEDVDRDGALLVRASNGELARVEAGDVTLRQ